METDKNHGASPAVTYLARQHSGETSSHPTRVNPSRVRLSVPSRKLSPRVLSFLCQRKSTESVATLGVYIHLANICIDSDVKQHRV